MFKSPKVLYLVFFSKELVKYFILLEFRFFIICIGLYNILKIKYEKRIKELWLVRENKKTEAWGVYPGGQSGNPGSFNYFKGVKEWGEGKYSKLLFNNNSEDNNEFVIFNKKFIK